MKPVAYVNHGRWVVDCPTPYCGYAHEVRPLLMIECQGCGQSYSATFPGDAPLIAAVLSRRIVVGTRNWFPGETVQDLEAENTAHRHEGVVI